MELSFCRSEQPLVTLHHRLYRLLRSYHWPAGIEWIICASYIGWVLLIGSRDKLNVFILFGQGCNAFVEGIET